jgi:arylsulfatase B/arylsulfatase I/J
MLRLACRTERRCGTAVAAQLISPVQEAEAAPLKTFAYVAHEAVHGPMEVPAWYLADGACAKVVPTDHPTRLIYCGMVRAVDDSVKNITATYQQLGLLESTLVVLTGDNGGIPKDGGNNFPLRGNKATTFEGGVRSIAFVSGAGIGSSMMGSASHGIMHVTDWLPTLVEGVAGLDLGAPTGRPCATCLRPVPPLDGVNQWSMLSAGAASARTEVLLDLQTTARNPAAKKAGTTVIPGSGAIRVGKWKLLHGHQGVWPGIA